MDPRELARIIDHTALRADTTKDQIIKLCNEALEFHFGAVCIAPVWIPLAREMLTGSDTKIVTVVGFPLGNTLPAVKSCEASRAIEAGADELDMVIHIGALKSEDRETVLNDILAVIETARKKPGTLVKVILETFLLTDPEKILACSLAEEAGANFVKTSTGFSGGGATAHDIVLLKRSVSTRMGIKAAGGIRDLTTALSMIEAGATRLGTSASVSIMKELLSQKP